MAREHCVFSRIRRRQVKRLPAVKDNSASPYAPGTLRAATDGEHARVAAFCERHPELAKIKNELLALGAYRAALSGSGSAIFGQFQMVSEAVRAASVMGRQFRVKVTKPLPRWEYFQRMVEE